MKDINLGSREMLRGCFTEIWNDKDQGWQWLLLHRAGCKEQKNSWEERVVVCQSWD